MQNHIESLPSGLEAMYDRMLSHLESKMNSAERTGKLVISLLLHGKSPISTQEIYNMLAPVMRSRSELKAIDDNTIQDNCGGFVEIDSEKNIRFIHQSARAFLASKPSIQKIPLPAQYQSADEHNNHFLELSSDDEKSITAASDTDETTSRHSWSSHPFSSGDSATSQSSVFSQLETVTAQFARMFANDQDLRPLILETLKKQGIAGFENTFSSLLSGYSKCLQLIAKAPSEQVAALMAGQKTHVIA